MLQFSGILTDGLKVKCPCRTFDTMSMSFDFGIVIQCQYREDLFELPGQVVEVFACELQPCLLVFTLILRDSI